jgi:site-specific DNA-methyltransferase (adenine-specific)
VGLPLRLIDLYTCENDLVLDPFMGSGSTLVAAARSNRRYVGYDLDATYVDIARLRVRDEGGAPVVVSETEPVVDTDVEDADSFQARATKEGKAAQALAEELLTKTGFDIKAKNSRLRGTGVTINFIATDRDDVTWYFDVSGAFTSTRGGLLRTDTVWKTLGRAHVLRGKLNGPLVFLTSHLPKKGSEGDVALRAAAEQGGFFDAIEMRSADGYERLRKYAAGGHSDVPLAGFLT